MTGDTGTLLPSKIKSEKLHESSAARQELRDSQDKLLQEGTGGERLHDCTPPQGTFTLLSENRPIRAARTAVTNKAQQLLCSVVFSLRWVLP